MKNQREHEFAFLLRASLKQNHGRLRSFNASNHSAGKIASQSQMRTSLLIVAAVVRRSGNSGIVSSVAVAAVLVL